jgi:hypothetical protein
VQHTGRAHLLDSYVAVQADGHASGLYQLVCSAPHNDSTIECQSSPVDVRGWEATASGIVNHTLPQPIRGQCFQVSTCAMCSNPYTVRNMQNCQPLCGCDRSQVSQEPPHAIPQSMLSATDVGIIQGNFLHDDNTRRMQHRS